MANSGSTTSKREGYLATIYGSRLGYQDDAMFEGSLKEYIDGGSHCPAIYTEDIARLSEHLRKLDLLFDLPNVTPDAESDRCADSANTTTPLEHKVLLERKIDLKHKEASQLIDEYSRECRDAVSSTKAAKEFIKL
jgi:hypothetical protein